RRRRGQLHDGLIARGNTDVAVEPIDSRQRSIRVVAIFVARHDVEAPIAVDIADRERVRDVEVRADGHAGTEYALPVVDEEPVEIAGARSFGLESRGSDQYVEIAVVVDVGNVHVVREARVTP